MSGSVITGAPPIDARRRARVAIPFAVVTLVWGSTWIVIRDQLGVVPPGWSVTYRFTLAAAATFAWVLASRAPFRLGWRGQLVALAVGLCQFVFNFNFVYRAEQYVTSGIVAVVFAILLVPNAILGRLFLGARLSRPFVAGSLVAMAGIALLFHHELAVAGAAGPAVARGIGFTLLAILSASVANVLQATRGARDVPVQSLVAWAMLWGALADAAIAWIMAGPPVIEARWSYLAGIAWLGLAGSALSFPLYYGVIRAIGPARAAYSSVLVPVIAMALSTVFEQYQWTPVAAAGAALTALGLVVALTARRG